MKTQGCFALVLMACAASSAAAGGLRGHPGQARGLAADTSTIPITRTTRIIPSIFGDGVEIHWDHSHVAYLRDGTYGTWSDTGTPAQLKAAWCAKTWETYDIVARHSWGSLKPDSKIAIKYWHAFDCDRVQGEADWCQAAWRQHGISPYSTRGTASDAVMAKWNKLDCNTKATWDFVPTAAPTPAPTPLPNIWDPKPVGYACSWDKDCAGKLECRATTDAKQCMPPCSEFNGTSKEHASGIWIANPVPNLIPIGGTKVHHCPSAHPVKEYGVFSDKCIMLYNCIGKPGRDSGWA